MPTKCQDCNTSFVLDANNIAQGTGCPNCGSDRLYRDQPSPTHSDGDLRNMYDTAEHEDMGGNPLAEGTIVGSDGERPAGKRDNYMHSRTAEMNFMDDDWGTDDPSHRVVVTRDGQVFSAPLPATHEQIAQANGLAEFPQNLSLGEKFDDGSTKWLQHDSGHDSAGLARLMEGHFGSPVDVDPNLQPSTNEERWFGDWQPSAPGEQNFPDFRERKNQEAEAIKQRGRPFPYYENPYFNRGGSVTGTERHLNTEPYTPWTHIADEEMIPEGDGTMVMAQPHPEAGFHFGPINLLSRLPTVTVNGLPVAANNKELYAQYGPSSELRNDPLEVSSYHPEFTNLAKRIIEDGHGMPAAYKDDVANIQARIKAGEIPPPPRAAHTASIKTAGFLAELAPMAAEAAPSLMRGVLKGIGSNLVGGGGEQQQQAPQPTVNPLPLTSRKADIETPSSVPSIGEHDDPDATDTQQFKDGDMDPNFENPNLNGEAGGSFAPNSQAIERMHLLGPLLLHYYHSDDSGANDPMIRELHNMMEKENPGYLDRVGPEHEEAMQRLLEEYRKPQGVTAAEIGAPAMTGVMTGPGGAQPGTMGQGSGPQPAVPNRCPYCGGTTTADGSCPQCGAKNGPAQNPGALPPGATQVPHPYVGKVAGPEDTNSDGIDPNQQGPKTPEQIAAVQQLLIDEGRVKEIPLVVTQPFNYAKELAQVANKINQPENVAPDDVTQPQPAMEETPPGAGMPMPAPPTGVQPMASVTAADSVAPRCPKCHSGTTKIVDSEGRCACHACGNVWKEGDLMEDKISAAPMIDEHMLRSPQETLLQSDNWPKGQAQTVTCPHCGSAVNPQLGLCPMCGGEIFPNINVQYAKTAQGEIPEGNAPAVPAAERHHPHDDRDIDQTRSWLDDDGNPLQRGMEYEMHNPSYRIPDIVTINSIKPDGITVTTEGEYDNQGAGLDYTHDISREEVQTEGITFVPINDGTEVPEQEPSQMDDAQRVNTEPTPSVQTPMVQQHAHVNQCSNCGELQGITSSMSSPTTYYHECFRCGNGWETRETSVESDDNLDSRSWLNEDDDDDGFWNGFDRVHAMENAGNESRNLSDIANRDPRNAAVKQLLNSQKIAGRKFTPNEQREFIEESGSARNSDLLDLEDTHYKLRDSSMVGTGKTTRMADGSLVREEDLFLGI